MNAFSKALTAQRDKRMGNKEGGFTLVELLIVVLIIGVLAAIAIPIYINVTATSKDNSTASSVTEAKTQILAYFTDTGKAPVDLAAAGVVSNADLPLTYFGAVSGTTFTFCVSGKYGDPAGAGTVYKATQATATTKGGTTCATAAG